MMISGIADVEIEVWKKVEGLENISASSLGRIRNDKHERVLISSVNNGDGRARICARSVEGVVKPYLVHRLVAQAFLTNEENKPFVCHKDGNCLNNKVENIYYGTAKDNYYDSIRHGTAYNTPTSNKIKKEIIRLFNEGLRPSQIQREIGSLAYCTVLNLVKKYKMAQV